MIKTHENRPIAKPQRRSGALRAAGLRGGGQARKPDPSGARVGVTQSGLSRRITTLERGLGVALFSSRGRAIAMTGDGSLAVLTHGSRPQAKV